MDKPAYAAGKHIGAIGRAMGSQRLIVAGSIAAVGVLIAARPAFHNTPRAGLEDYLLAMGAITAAALLCTAFVSLIFRRSQAQHWAGNFGKIAIGLACLLLLGEWQGIQRQAPARAAGGGTASPPSANFFDQFDPPPNAFDEFSPAKK